MRKNRIVSFCLAVALCLGLSIPAQAAGTTFPDVQPGDWYYDTVMDMVEQGIVNGYPDGTFDPSGYISMAEFCKLTLAVMPAGDQVNKLSSQTPEELDEAIQANNPGYWANDVILACNLRGLEICGIDHEEWNKYITREWMVVVMAMLYTCSNEAPLLYGDDVVTWSIGDYLWDNIEGSAAEPAIVWAYSQGLVGGVNETNDFAPHSMVTRAEACTVLSRFIHPEKRLSFDIEEAEAKMVTFNSPKVRLEDGVDFTGKPRMHFSTDIAYDYCRRLENEIGVQIFYLPEFTEKENGLAHYANWTLDAVDAVYFAGVLRELQDMKEAFTSYPEGFLKEFIAKTSTSHGTEIIVVPVAPEGATVSGGYVYDDSQDQVKVDQIYYMGNGDPRYYSHEMGHMVMSRTAILSGYSKVREDWEELRHKDILATTTAYGMKNVAEDWAETWASLWHETDEVAELIADYPVIKEKIQYMTDLLRAQYDTMRDAALPWDELL